MHNGYKYEIRIISYAHMHTAYVLVSFRAYENARIARNAENRALNK